MVEFSAGLAGMLQCRPNFPGRLVAQMPYRKIDRNRKSFYLIIATVAVDTVGKFVSWEKIHHLSKNCLA